MRHAESSPSTALLCILPDIPSRVVEDSIQRTILTTRSGKRRAAHLVCRSKELSTVTQAVGQSVSGLGQQDLRICSGLVDRRMHRLMQLAAKSPSSRHRSDNSSGERHTSQLRSADQIGVGLLNDERHVPARMKRSFFGGTVGPSNSLSRTMHPHDQPDVRH
ncbi:MAG: hypothetical protein ACI93T_002385 [Porticoccaceae bacterium]